MPFVPLFHRKNIWLGYWVAIAIGLAWWDIHTYLSLVEQPITATNKNDGVFFGIIMLLQVMVMPVLLVIALLVCQRVEKVDTVT